MVKLTRKHMLIAIAMMVTLMAYAMVLPVYAIASRSEHTHGAKHTIIHQHAPSCLACTSEKALVSRTGFTGCSVVRNLATNYTDTNQDIQVKCCDQQLSIPPILSNVRLNN